MGWPHLDGVADTGDAFSGAFTRSRRLEIMRDSRVGTFGALSLILVIILKAAAAGHLIANGGVVACIAVVVLARFFMAALIVLGHYARMDGVAWHVFANRSPSALVPAALFSVPCLFVPAMLPAVLGMAVTAAIVRWRAEHLVGGLTGDTLGAGCEFCETAGFVVLALIFTT